MPDVTEAFAGDGFATDDTIQARADGDVVSIPRCRGDGAIASRFDLNSF